MLRAKLEIEPSANGPMATHGAMRPLVDGSISNFACNISNYLCTNFGAFIKKCTIRPKMAAYPLYYYYTLSSEWIVITSARVKLYMLGYALYLSHTV